jgi:hypothetical protein
VTAPLVYLVLLAVILCGDVVLASLRFGALLGIPVDGLPIGGSVLDLLTGLLFLAVLATYGCVCWTSPGSPRCAVRTGSQTAGPARRSSAPLSPGRPCRCSRPRCSSCGGNTRSSARRAQTSRRCSSRSSPCFSSGRAFSPQVVRWVPSWRSGSCSALSRPPSWACSARSCTWSSSCWTVWRSSQLRLFGCSPAPRHGAMERLVVLPAFRSLRLSPLSVPEQALPWQPKDRLELAAGP